MYYVISGGKRNLALSPWWVVAIVGLFPCIALPTYLYSQPKEAQPTTLFTYDVDVNIISLIPPPAIDPYVIALQPGKQALIKDWFHNRVKVQKRGKETTGYYGDPLGPDRPKSPHEDPSKYFRYSGNMSIGVLSDEFPLRIEYEFKWKNLVDKATNITISGEASFSKEGDLIVSRSADGNYVLLARLEKRRN